MPADDLKPAIRAALRMHEIGKGTPYRLYFAGKAKSGASFGFMQGDLAAGQAVVTDTFVSILTDAGASSTRISKLVARLSVHVVSNPLNQQDTKFVNDALQAGSGKVDKMDEAILQSIYRDLDKCISDVGSGGRQITGKALLYAALWINMSGPPTKLRDWLSGKDPHLGHPVPPAPTLVGASDIRAYLMATDYYTANPGNAQHLDDSVQAGAQKLPPGAVAP